MFMVYLVLRVVRGLLGLPLKVWFSGLALKVTKMPVACNVPPEGTNSNACEERPGSDPRASFRSEAGFNSLKPKKQKTRAMYYTMSYYNPNMVHGS